MFAYMVHSDGKAVRCISLARAEVCTGVINLIYNMLLLHHPQNIGVLKTGNQGEKTPSRQHGKT